MSHSAWLPVGMGWVVEREGRWSSSSRTRMSVFSSPLKLEAWTKAKSSKERRKFYRNRALGTGHWALHWALAAGQGIAR